MLANRATPPAFQHKRQSGWRARVSYRVRKIFLKQYEGATYDCTSAIQIDPLRRRGYRSGYGEPQMNDYEGAKK